MLERPEEYVKISESECSPETIIKNAYDMSIPVGMGILHSKEGPIPDELITQLMSHRSGNIRMDYVSGRQVKLTIFRENGNLLISPIWYDHSHEQLVELLTRCGISDAEERIAVAIRVREETTLQLSVIQVPESYPTLRNRRRDEMRIITDVRVRVVQYWSHQGQCTATNIMYMLNGSPASARVHGMVSVGEATMLLRNLRYSS